MILPGSTIVAATGNKGKIRELTDLLADSGLRVASLKDWPHAPEPEETGSTFAANALIKARSAAAHTGLPALADDSGLMVDALDGAPGVRSARFAGEHAADADNNALLLQRLAGVQCRTAAFACALALVLPTGEEHVFEGRTTGVILDAPRGAGGFGYDPLFLSDDLGQTFAEAALADKNRISHRGRALRAFLAALKK